MKMTFPSCSGHHAANCLQSLSICTGTWCTAPCRSRSRTWRSHTSNCPSGSSGRSSAPSGKNTVLCTSVKPSPVLTLSHSSSTVSESQPSSWSCHHSTSSCTSAQSSVPKSFSPATGGLPGTSMPSSTSLVPSLHPWYCLTPPGRARIELGEQGRRPFPWLVCTTASCAYVAALGPSITSVPNSIALLPPLRPRPC